MIPKILDLDNDRIAITPQSLAIPELKKIYDKYPVDHVTYLTYVYMMTAPDSPYINVPIEEKQEQVVYDIKSTLGDFDMEEPLLNDAIKKLKSLYMTRLYALSEELGEELDRFRRILRDTPVTLGEFGNFRDRMALLERIDKISSSYEKVKKQANEEAQAFVTRGDHEMGMY
jgi:hypothetical protein